MALSRTLSRVMSRLLSRTQVGGGDTTPGGSADALLLENGSDGFLLEGGSGVILME